MSFCTKASAKFINVNVVYEIWRMFGQAQVDLFATQETLHCPLWFSRTERHGRGFICMPSPQLLLLWVRFSNLI